MAEIFYLITHFKTRLEEFRKYNFLSSLISTIILNTLIAVVGQHFMDRFTYIHNLIDQLLSIEQMYLFFHIIHVHIKKKRQNAAPLLT